MPIKSVPDFIAGLLATTVFCTVLTALNALTRIAVPFAPNGLDEGGFVQYGAALLFAGFAWRRATRPQPAAFRR